MLVGKSKYLFRIFTAITFFIEGDIIYKLTRIFSSKSTRETIEIGDGRPIFDEFVQFMNHSFKPSVNVAGEELIAIKQIVASDEITRDYTENESNSVSSFFCYETGITVYGDLCKM